MGYVRHFGGKVLWSCAGAVVVVSALVAGTMFASAAPPGLPKKTPAQLLAAMRHATLPPAMTAVISESANLGFPALPDIAGLPSSALSAASWLAGSHTVQIWYSGPRHVRIAVPVSFGETDLRVNGSQVWLWQSQGQVATHIILGQPAGKTTALWRLSHLRPAQVAHIPAFLQQQVRLVPGTTPALPGNTPASMRRLILRLSQSSQVSNRTLQREMAALMRSVRATQANRATQVSRAIQANKARSQAACPALRALPVNIKNLGNNGGGFINFNPVHPGWKAVPFRIVRLAPAKLRALMKLRGLKVSPNVAVGVLKAVTPLQAAQRLLAMLGPTTNVTVTGTTVVAGRPAYQLSIEPRSNQSLIGQILIAVDAKSYLPLQVQVIPRGSSSPAFQIGFTTFSPGQPAASNFTFTPPPGAHVHVVRLPGSLAGLTGLGGLGGLAGLGGLSGVFGGQSAPAVAVPRVMVPKVPLPKLATPGVHVRVLKLNGQITKVTTGGSVGLTCLRLHQAIAAAPRIATVPSAGPRVLGSGWLSVAVIPAGQALSAASGSRAPAMVKPGTHGSPVPAAGGQAIAMLRTLLNSATRVHGAWGSGRLISTRLVNILITSKDQVLIGAVTPAVLFADAAKI